MWTQQQIDEIVDALWHLPGNKLLEAKQYILDLKKRFGYPTRVDCSDEWTREDELDFTRASVREWEAREAEGTEHDAPPG